MAFHDPESVASELGAKLASKSRHVCAFLGAGAGVSAGLPDVRGLEKLVSDGLTGDFKTAFDRALKGRDLEAALSRIRRIKALLDPGETFSGLDAKQAAELDRQVCAIIIQGVSKPGKSTQAFKDFALWAARAQYDRPLELFTSNYDLLIEGGLEEVGAPYFDGFVGNIKARFRADLVDTSVTLSSVPASFVRLWKIHGSVNWKLVDDGGKPRILRTAVAAIPGEPTAIFPSDEKYDDSRRVPFVVLIDRFRRAIHEPETVLFTSGYSFGDQHLNEIIFDAAQLRPRSEFVALCYSEIPTALAEVALEVRNVTVLAATEAIIGGHRQPWEDKGDLVGIYEGKKYRLGDFAVLASFLSSGTTNA